MFKQKIKTKWLLLYEHLFEDKPKSKPDDYFIGSDPKYLKPIVHYFLNKKEDHDPLTKLAAILNEDCRELYEGLTQKINSLSAETGHELYITNHYNSLNIYEILLRTESERTTKSSSEMFVDLLKAFLLLNSIYTKNLESIDDQLKSMVMPGLEYLRILMKRLPSSDIDNFEKNEIYYSQIVKGFLYFDFLRNFPETQELVQRLANENGFESVLKYFEELLSLAKEVNNWDKDQFQILNPVGNIELILKLFDQLVLDSTLLDQYDFLTIRTYPFYKTSDNAYAVVFPGFAIEQLYKSQYFRLLALQKKHKRDDFRRIQTHEFSEKTLFYKVIKLCFPSPDFSKSGEESGLKGFTDYYIRSKNEIYLFESKDNLLAAKTKSSWDVEIVKAFLERTFVKDEKEGEKAILQLQSSIEKVIEGLIPDLHDEHKEYLIYPLIVTYDSIYDCMGMNKLVALWFYQNIQKFKYRYNEKFKIRPVVILNIDTLIRYQPHFARFEPLSVFLEGFYQSVKEPSPSGDSGFMDDCSNPEYSQDFTFFVKNSFEGKSVPAPDLFKEIMEFYKKKELPLD
jgi:hypothetical protein